MALTQSSEEGLKISNAGTNGQYLQKQSGNTGGLTWADVPAGVGGATGVDFNDNVKARFGTGNDLEIYHDGTNTYQVNTTGSLVHRSTGEIYIQSDGGVRLTDVGNNETFLKCIDNGAVELYHDNSKKAETTADGLTISGVTVSTGNIQINNDTGKIRLGASQDLNIYHDGSHSYISDTGTGDLYIRSSKVYIQSGEGNNENIITGAADGAAELYYDNSKKFETTSGGVKVTGNLSVYGDDVRNDGYKSKWGTGDDLQIQADGSNSKIVHNGDGNLVIEAAGADEDITIQATDDVFIKVQGNENAIRCLGDGAVELYHNNSTKLVTSSDGITMTGNISFDSGNNGLYLGGSGGGNHLNDYEEGTWTPDVKFNDVSADGQTANGNYTKIGNMVYAAFQFTLTSKGSGDGQFHLNGFPFAPSTGYSDIASGMGYMHRFADTDNTNGQVYQQFYSSIMYLAFRGLNGNTNRLTDDNFRNDTAISGMVCYRTNA